MGSKVRIVVILGVGVWLALGGCTDTCPPGAQGSLFCAGSDASVAPPDGAPVVPDPCEDAEPGDACAEDMTCSAGGACTCGNGAIDPGEECDDASAGCTTSCLWECSESRACPEAAACHEPTTCELASHTCQEGAPLPEGTMCDGGVCDDAGNCLDCSRAGDACQPLEPCMLGEIVCTDGVASCEETVPAETGTECTTDDGAGGTQTGICDGTGGCQGCDDAGAPCLPPNVCMTGVIACEAGAPVCVEDQPVPAGTECGPGSVCDGDGTCGSCDDPPGDEICDGHDNDCDGSVDEALDAPPCALQDGVCAGSVQTCTGETGWLECLPADYGPDFETDETSCDGLDNDCDGQADETCDCVVGTQETCGSDTGACVAGVRTCEVDGWGPCDGEVGPETEVCDGADNDCNGIVDDDTATDAQKWYEDGDGDGYGNPQSTTVSCQQPTGYVDNGDDCDDGNAQRNPGLGEICDGLDNDCNLVVDDGASDAITWYEDADGDDWGNGAVTVASCTMPPGYVGVDGDCDDGNAQRYPGLAEVCDGLDNDCNLIVDDGASDAATWYQDADGDGVGNGGVSTQSCTQPPGYVSTSGDCDDGNAARRPGLAEICDGLDNDCNLVVDDGAADAGTWYQDADGDGWGNGNVSAASCAQPPGYVATPGDCDDGNASRYPGLTEVCDGVDNNCNGAIDDGAVDAGTWYQDADGDGWGNGNVSTASCGQPPGYVATPGDCDDGNASRNPGLNEVCDGIDNNCNGAIDDNAVNAPTWWRDADGDGWGNPNQATQLCTQPPGWVNNNGDCDDSTVWRRPGLPEWCDGLDNDCNPATVEQCPYECIPTAWGGHQYLFCNGDSEWTEARDACQGQAMRLVRIDSAAENNWVRATGNALNGGGQNLWIGASDRAQENRWVWIDGAHFWQGRDNGNPVGGLFSRWDPGEPNDDGTEDCAEMQGDGEWNDKECGDDREFVCERY